MKARERTEEERDAIKSGFGTADRNSGAGAAKAGELSWEKGGQIWRNHINPHIYDYL